MKRQHAGLTLVEVLVATSLLSLTLLLLNAAFHSVQRASASTTEAAGQLSDLRLVRRFVADQLAQAQPLARREAEGLRMQFAGGEQQLRFVGKLPAHRGEGGLHVIQIGLETGASPALVLLDSPAEPGMDFHAGDHLPLWRRTVLLDAPGNVRFRYFGARADEPPAWHAQWQGHSQLPELVELTLDDGSGQWPPVAVVLPVRDPAGQAQLVW